MPEEILPETTEEEIIEAPVDEQPEGVPGGDAEGEVVDEEPVEWDGEARIWADLIGMPEEDRQKFSDPESFAAVVDKIYSTMSRQSTGKQQAPERQNGHAENGRRAQQPQEPPPSNLPEINFDDFDEPTANVLKAMYQHSQAQEQRIEKLVSALDTVSESVQVQNQAGEEVALARHLDNIFSRLGNQDAFGSGSLMAGGLSDDECDRRIMLAQLVRAERDAAETRGDDLPPEEIHYHRKARQLFGSLAGNMVRKAAERSEKVASHATPSGMKSSRKGGKETLSPDQRLMQGIENWQRQYNTE